MSDEMVLCVKCEEVEGIDRVGLDLGLVYCDDCWERVLEDVARDYGFKERRQ